MIFENTRMHGFIVIAKYRRSNFVARFWFSCNFNAVSSNWKRDWKCEILFDDDERRGRRKEFPFIFFMFGWYTPWRKWLLLEFISLPLTHKSHGKMERKERCWKCMVIIEWEAVAPMKRQHNSRRRKKHRMQSAKMSSVDEIMYRVCVRDTHRNHLLSWSTSEWMNAATLVHIHAVSRRSMTIDDIDPSNRVFRLKTSPAC